MSIKETLLQTAAAELDEATHRLVKAQKELNEVIEGMPIFDPNRPKLRLIDEHIEEVINRLGV